MGQQRWCKKNQIWKLTWFKKISWYFIKYPTKRPGIPTRERGLLRSQLILPSNTFNYCNQTWSKCLMLLLMFSCVPLICNRLPRRLILQTKVNAANCAMDARWKNDYYSVRFVASTLVFCQLNLIHGPQRLTLWVEQDAYIALWIMRPYPLLLPLRLWLLLLVNYSLIMYCM